MASTYTSSLLMEKVGDGEQAGTWDDTLRDMFDLIDYAIAGSASITAASGTLTLEDANNTADRGKAMALSITSTLTGNLSVVVPNRSKLYLVRNGSSGAYTVTIKTSGGAGVAVTQGTACWLYVDGSDGVYFMSPEVTPASGVLAGVSNSFAAIDINGGTIDGAVIGGSTPAAGTFTTLTTTGNVGIGGTPVSYPLEVFATASNARMQIKDTDTAKASALALTEYLGSDGRGAFVGINAGALVIFAETAVADGITFKTGATEGMRVTHSQTVGIGETAPLGKLHVKSAANAGGAASNADADDVIIENSTNTGISIISSTTGTGNIYFGDASASSSRGAIVYDHSTDAFKFSTAGLASERMRIDSSGNVNIGGTNGTRALSVSQGTVTWPTFTDVGQFAIGRNASAGNIGRMAIIGSATGGSEIEFGDENDADVGSIYYDHSGDSMRFSTSATERLRIDSSGNVGIGETAPLGKLHVKSGDAGSVAPNAGGDELIIENSGDAGITIYAGTTSKSQIFFGDADGDTVGMVRYDHNNNSMSFRTFQVDNVLIDSSGNVGIGKTPSTYKLEVNGAAQATNIFDQVGLLAPHKNLKIFNNASNPTYQVDITADTLVAYNTDNIGVRLTSVSETVDLTASGASGLDTGTEATSTWYYIWIIYNGSTVNALLSTSSTAPTMPSGYTYKGLVGAIYNDSGGDLLRIAQNDRLVSCAVQTALSLGGSTTYASISLAAFVPPNAQQLVAVMVARDTSSSVFDVRLAPTGDEADGYIQFALSVFGTAVQQIPVVCQLFESQTTYYKVGDANEDLTLSIRGWSY